MANADSGQTPRQYSEKIPNAKPESEETGADGEDVKQGFKRIPAGKLTHHAPGKHDK